MTQLYRPVTIESAEQAEALPEEAVVINTAGDRYNRAVQGQWHSAADDRDLAEDLDSNTFPVTITALVPIEAEEETHSVQTRGQAHPEWRTRLVTPWEES